RTILCSVKRMTSAAAARIEHALPRKELGAVRGHVLQEVPLPLVSHLREAPPLEAEALRRGDLPGIRTVVSARSQQGLAHRGQEHARDAVDHGEGFVAPVTPQRLYG